MRKSRRLISGMAIAALTLTLAACSTSESSDATNKDGDGAPRIGYVDVQAQGAMQIREWEFFKAGADLLGWDVSLQDAAGDPAAGLKAVQSFVAQQYDAIVVSCIDAGPLLPGIQSAYEADIPVLQVECPGERSDEGRGFTAVYAGPEEELSQCMADYVSEQHGAGAEVAVLRDDALEAGRIRSEVVHEGMEENGLDVVAATTIPMTNIDAVGKSSTAAILTGNPELEAVVAVFDFFAGPAISAIDAANRSDSVALYSWYADEVNLPLMLREGSPLVAVVDTPVEQTALVAVDQLLYYFEEGRAIDPAAADEIEWECSIFTQDDHPELTDDFITPWDVNEFLEPLVERWNADLGLELSL